MSSSIFRVFGILLLALLIYFVLDRISNKNQPVMRTAAGFVQAIQQQNGAAVDSFVDAKCAVVMKAGNNVTQIAFKQVNLPGAFMNRPEILWTYLDLKAIMIPSDIIPKIEDDSNTSDNPGLATVSLGDKGRMYLHRVNGDWKIFYLAKPDTAGEKFKQ